MPELPELEVLRQDLAARCLGKTIAATVVNRKECVNVPPAQYERAIVGGVIRQVWRKGKTVVLDLSNDLSLLIHLALGGQVLLKDSMDHDPWEAQIVLGFADGTALHFNRLVFGNVHVVRTYDVPLTRLGKLGPDALNELPDAEGLRALYGSKGGAMKPLLCDQALLSGVGNMWSDEVLFQARISPESPGKALSAGDFARLHGALRDVLTAAIEAKGAVEGGFTTLDGQPGSAESLLRVHGRTGEPCRACGGTVRQAKVSGKTTYLCRKCQPKKSPRKAAPRRVATKRRSPQR